ncbi:hypothetical protein SB6415_05348 [Klebsiella pasteurii]|nr:hypothetical protein SB6415_05348 [Klebsiella pasteurii]
MPHCIRKMLVWHNSIYLNYPNAGARTRSPGRRSAPPGEQSAGWHHFPEAMLRICPGYACRTVCDLLREFIQHPDKLGNEAILVIVPGHGFHQLQIANLSNLQLRGIVN